MHVTIYCWKIRFCSHKHRIIPLCLRASQARLPRAESSVTAGTKHTLPSVRHQHCHPTCDLSIIPAHKGLGIRCEPALAGWHFQQGMADLGLQEQGWAQCSCRMFPPRLQYSINSTGVKEQLPPHWGCSQLLNSNSHIRKTFHSLTPQHQNKHSSRFWSLVYTKF